MDKTRTVLTWLIFTVIFGVTPIVVNFIYLRTISRSTAPIPMEKLLGKGELFLVAALLARDALGRLFNGFPANQWVRLLAIVAGAACIGIVIWSSVQFAYLVPSLLAEGGKPVLSGPAAGDFNIDVVVHDSQLAFAYACLTGLGVIVMVEE
jgi:hypothetical protein